MEIKYIFFLIIFVVCCVIAARARSYHRKIMRILSHTTPGEKYLNIKSNEIYIVHYTSENGRKVTCSKLNESDGEVYTFKRDFFENFFIRVSVLIDE